MALVPMGPNDTAQFPLNASQEVAVTNFVYSNPSDAANAYAAYNDGSDEEIHFPIPDGSLREITRGMVLFAWHNQNCVIMVLRHVTGTPLPWWP